jgi:Transposase DDE domain
MRTYENVVCTYENVVRPHRKEGRFADIRKQILLKYHIIAILDYLIILRAKITTEHTHDSPVLRGLLPKSRFAGILKGSVFNADRAYNAEENFKRISELSTIPNIKQKAVLAPGHRRKSQPYRIRARKLFDEKKYHYRGLIESIFGAEESDGRNLKTNFRIKQNQERWGKIVAIGWNLNVLNRLKSANILGIKTVPSVKN